MRPCADRGIAIPELLVALVVALLVGAAALALVDAAEQSAIVTPAAVDVYQRLRMGADALVTGIGGAGAGLDGGIARGPLVWFLPPVLPRRLGLQAPDAPTTARPDAVTLLSIPASTPQSSTAAVLGPGSLLVLSGGGGCPGSTALCGLAPNTDIVVFDRSGVFDLFTIADASGVLIPHGSSGRVYDPGTPAAVIAQTTYYFDAGSRQLRQYDGYQSDVPLIDNVVAARFDLLGSPEPPTRPRPPASAENCLYDAAGVLKPLPWLTPTDGALALMPPAMLADGPWCGSGATIFDADLFRVRAVRVTLRVQASVAAVRGSGPWFLQPGVARANWRLVPDAQVTVVIRPRNLHS